MPAQAWWSAWAPFSESVIPGGGPSAHQRSRIAPVSRPGVPGWGGRGREEGSGCLVHRIHCDSDPGVSVEPKGSRVAPVQVGLYRGAVQRGLGYKSRQVQSLRQGQGFWFSQKPRGAVEGIQARVICWTVLYLPRGGWHGGAGRIAGKRREGADVDPPPK